MAMARFELSQQDREQIMSGVSCATVLERNGYMLDKAESSANCLKYRPGKGYPIIVTHQGKGWWDTGCSGSDPDGKGTVFDLLRHLRPELRWRECCLELGALIGIEPEGAVFVREQKRVTPAESPAQRWVGRRPLRRGSKVWNYLALERCLPDWLLDQAIRTDCIRDGFHAAWFCHREKDGTICGVELRGPDTRCSLTGTVKTLFRFRLRGTRPVTRLVVCESAIDALSCSALDEHDGERTAYASTSGGFGPETETALRSWLEEMRGIPHAMLVAGTDNDRAGENYAAMLEALAAEYGVAYERFAPPGGEKDWNAVLQRLMREYWAETAAQAA
ncbi:hypothetical protein AA12717_0941 [Gluconacetobacter sacchari DSM 12717]|nr:hypothetical protein AA12717_0941 [Gluconacetobacter sacchari DSM 12717]